MNPTPVPNGAPPTGRPALTDRDALLRQRQRAVRQGHVDVLHQIAADEIEDRLAEINRSFTSPAVVTGFPNFGRRAFRMPVLSRMIRCWTCSPVPMIW